MSDIELLQGKIFEEPTIFEIKKKINELIRDVNHINKIVTANNLSIKLLEKDFKNLQRFMVNQ